MRGGDWCEKDYARRRVVWRAADCAILVAETTTTTAAATEMESGERVDCFNGLCCVKCWMMMLRTSDQDGTVHPRKAAAYIIFA